MYEVILLNEKGQRFTKTFESEYLLRKFLYKVKYTTKLTLLSWYKKY